MGSKFFITPNLKRFRLLGLLGFAAAAGAPAAMGAENVSKPDIQIISAAAPLQIYHNLSTEQITSMRHSRFPSARMHSPGITMAESELKTDYQLEFRQKPGSSVYQMWTTSVTVVFDYTRMDVYISSQYGEGSCEYNQILAHEKQHVAIDERVLEQYKNKMAYALRHTRLIPTLSHPLLVSSPEQGKVILSKRLSGLVRPYFNRYHAAVKAQNAKIDTFANYRKVQARCNGW